jgi:hypothetical protein
MRSRSMSKRLLAAISLIVVLATLGVTSTATADPNNATPASPGACNMLHASGAGMNGMMNDRHVDDIMMPLVEASLAAGCQP